MEKRRSDDRQEGGDGSLLPSRTEESDHLLNLNFLDPGQGRGFRDLENQNRLLEINQ